MIDEHQRHFEAVEAAIKAADLDLAIPFGCETETLPLTFKKTVIDIIRAIYQQDDCRLILEDLMEKTILQLASEIQGNPEHEIYMSGYQEAARE